mmetsp:Transcript_5226/g.17240  ORF Transcript_5226/g.17240 Transcript_5226/m.17240 type:complete len:445 (+) Transcript_5226:893-2227(+)
MFASSGRQSSAAARREPWPSRVDPSGSRRRRRSDGRRDGDVERALKVLHGGGGVGELVDAEEADAKGLRVFTLAELERDARRDLRAGGEELGEDRRVVGVDDNHARRLEPGRRDGDEAAVALQHAAHQPSELEGGLLGAVEPEVARHHHGVTRHDEGIGRHCGMVGEAARLVRVHHREPLAQVACERGARGGPRRLDAALRQHHDRSTRRARPALLRRGDERVDPVLLHVDPDGARGDRVEHEDAAHLVHRGREPGDVLVRQQDPRRRLDLRREEDGRLLGADPLLHLLDRRRGKLLLALDDVAGPRLHHHRLGRDIARVEDVGPSPREVAVPQHHRLLARRKLPRDRLHAVRPRPGDDDSGIGAVDVAEKLVHVEHHLLERLRHVVERTVGVDDRKLLQRARRLRKDARRAARHLGDRRGARPHCRVQRGPRGPSSSARGPQS